MSRRCECCRRCPDVVPSGGFPTKDKLADMPDGFIDFVGVLADIAQDYDEISEDERYTAVEFVLYVQRTFNAPRRQYVNGEVLRLKDLRTLRSTPWQ